MLVSSLWSSCGPNLVRLNVIDSSGVNSTTWTHTKAACALHMLAAFTFCAVCLYTCIQAVFSFLVARSVSMFAADVASTLIMRHLHAFSEQFTYL